MRSKRIRTAALLLLAAGTLTGCLTPPEITPKVGKITATPELPSQPAQLPAQPGEPPTLTPWPTPTTPPSPTITVCIVNAGGIGNSVNVREGPGMSWPVVDIVTHGETLFTEGEPVNGWQRVTTPRLQQGWFYTERWCEP